MVNEKISVVLPCYNEKDNILLIVKQIHEQLDCYSHEIIVIDDNSPDGTYDVVNMEQLDYVRAINRLKGPSLGKSIRRGIEEAEGDIIVIMDSDFNHRPEEIPILLNGLRYFDCVIASRFVYGGYMPNRFRYLASWLFNIFVRTVTGNHITDSLYGFIAVRNKHIKKLDYDKIFYGYGDYYIRFIFYLQCNDLAILQVPSILGVRPAGTGNRQFIRTFLKYTKETLKLVFKRKKKGQVVLKGFQQLKPKD